MTQFVDHSGSVYFITVVVMVQGDHLNQRRTATVLCVPLTGNLVWAEAPGTRAQQKPQVCQRMPLQMPPKLSLLTAFLDERGGRLGYHPDYSNRFPKDVDIALGN